VLYGIAPVLECLRARRRVLERLYLREGKLSPRLLEVRKAAEAAGVPVREVSVHDLGNLTLTRHHQGAALACGDLPTFGLEPWLHELGTGPAFLLALDQVEDPQNLGGLVRSAAFLGADAVLVHRAHASPMSAVASKASAGALEHFPVIEAPNLAQALTRLHEALFMILGAANEPEAVDYREPAPAERAALVMGNEGSGLRPLTRKRCDALVRIPGRPAAESLNVTVAAGVIMSRLIATT